MRHFEGFFEGAKRSRPPKKIPRNAPLCFLPQTKKLDHTLSESEVHWYFYVPIYTRKREGERGGELDREQES
jgi:hypothetical protein